MYLPKSLLVKRVMDADLKLIAAASYDVVAIQKKTEYAGVFNDGTQTLAATTANTTIDNVNGTYELLKGTGVSQVNGTVIALGALDFRIQASGKVNRKGIAQGTVHVELVGANFGVIASQKISASANSIESFAFDISGSAVDAAEAISCRIVRSEIAVDEDFEVTDYALFLESDT